MMNDLDALRTMRADAPVPSRARLDAGRERLLAAVSAPTAPRTGRPAGAPRRIRRSLLAGGAAAVALAVTVVAVVTQERSRPATLNISPEAHSAHYADPLVERAAFGWLPSGMRTNGYVADHQHERYFQATAQHGRAGASVTLTAYDRGPEPQLPHLPGGVPGRRIPAEPVNGHTAYWIFKPNPAGQSSFELRWQYASHSWADLQGVGLRGSAAELTRTAYRIARSARFGGSRPIALPLHVGGVPGGLTPDRTVLNNGAHGQVGAILVYVLSGPESSLSVSVDKTSALGPPAPDGQVDGHPARRTRGVLYVYRVNGFTVQITASGSVLAALDRTGGITALFRKMTVFGPDPADWTTNPVN